MGIILHSLSGIVAIDDQLPNSSDPDRDITMALNSSQAIKEAMEKAPILTEENKVNNNNNPSPDNTLDNNPSPSPGPRM